MSPATVNARPLGVSTGASADAVADTGAPVFLTVPTPPSLNKSYNRRKGPGRDRFLSKAARDWKAEAKTAVRLQKPAHVCGPVIVVLNIERKSASADVDNRVKLLLDLLVKSGVIDDDRKVAGFAAAWSPKHSDKTHLAVLPAGRIGVTFLPAETNGAVGGWILNAPNFEHEAE